LFDTALQLEKRRSSPANVSKKVQVTDVDDIGRDRFEIVSVQHISPTGCRILLHFRCRPQTVATGLEFLGGLRLPDTLAV
jgi:hypothetical protein